VKQLADQGLMMTQIGKQLGLAKSQVTAAWNYWHASRGLTPPEALPLINTPIGTVGTVAAAMVGAIAGGIGGAALMASRRLPTGKDVQAEAVTSDDDRTTPGGRNPGGD